MLASRNGPASAQGKTVRDIGKGVNACCTIERARVGIIRILRI